MRPRANGDVRILPDGVVPNPVVVGAGFAAVVGFVPAD
jgi:hypothetical protein